MKINKLKILLIVLIGLPSVACGQSGQTNSNQSSSDQKQTSEIPSAVKNSTYDSSVNSESVVFIKIAADNNFYLRKSGLSEYKDGKIINYYNYTLLTDANLISEITRALRDKAPDKRLAYIQAETGVKFGRLAEMFEKMVKSDADLNNFQLVVNPLKEVEKSRQTDSGGYVLNLILPPKPVLTDKNRESGGTGNGRGNGRDDSPSPPAPPAPPGYKPKPKTAEQLAAEEKNRQLELEKAEARKKIKVEKLSIELNDAGQIKFNNNAQTADEFAANLKKIFDERTAYDIFFDGTNEVNKAVYLKIAPNVNYDAVIKLIDEIYGLGANRLYLDGLAR